MYVPVEIRDLQSLPRPNIHRHIARVRNLIKNYMPDDDYQFYDTLYKYKPSSDYYNWVPPFKSRFLIAECNVLHCQTHLDVFSALSCVELQQRDLPLKSTLCLVPCVVCYVFLHSPFSPQHTPRLPVLNTT